MCLGFLYKVYLTLLIFLKNKSSNINYCFQVKVWFQNRRAKIKKMGFARTGPNGLIGAPVLGTPSSPEEPASPNQMPTSPNENSPPLENRGPSPPPLNHQYFPNNHNTSHSSPQPNMGGRDMSSHQRVDISSHHSDRDISSHQGGDMSSHHSDRDMPSHHGGDKSPHRQHNHMNPYNGTAVLLSAPHWHQQDIKPLLPTSQPPTSQPLLSTSQPLLPTPQMYDQDIKPLLPGAQMNMYNQYAWYNNDQMQQQQEQHD